jgi:hypothetical protein
MRNFATFLAKVVEIEGSAPVSLYQTDVTSFSEDGRGVKWRIHELWPHDSSNFALHYITTMFLSKHFLRKKFLPSVDPKQHI